MITDIALIIIAIYCVVKICEVVIGGISINVEVKSPENDDNSTTLTDNDIVGVSKWTRLQQLPSPATTIESTSSAQIPEDKLDETFTHNEFTPDGDYDELTKEELESENLTDIGLDKEQQAQGVSFGELGEAVDIAKKRNPTHSEKIRSADLFAKIEDSDLDHQLRCGDKVLNQHITKLLNERIAHYNKLQRRGVAVDKPAGVDTFNISDFV